MGDYKRSGGFGGKGGKGGFKRDGGRRDFGDKSDFRRGGGDRDRAEMFSATCASCHKHCEVPFRPNSDRPVYCSDCFRSNKDGSPSDSGRRDNNTRDNNTRVASGRYPNKQDVHSSASSSDGRQLSELKKQLESVNNKLEKIIYLMGGKPQAPVAEKKVEKEVSLNDVIQHVIEPKKKEKKKSGKKDTKKNSKKTTKKATKKVTKKKRVAKKKA